MQPHKYAPSIEYSTRICIAAKSLSFINREVNDKAQCLFKMISVQYGIIMILLNSSTILRHYTNCLVLSQTHEQKRFSDITSIPNDDQMQLRL